jgi:hypothetical protein
LRQEYQETLKNIPKENLIYLDESGFDLTIKKEYGWKLRGQRLFDNKKGQRKYLKRITVISAYSNNTKKLIAPFYFEGNTNFEMFNLWIKEVLLLELKPGQTIIMDNAAFHKNKITRELIESKQCHLLLKNSFQSQ